MTLVFPVAVGMMGVVGILAYIAVNTNETLEGTFILWFGLSLGFLIPASFILTTGATGIVQTYMINIARVYVSIISTVMLLIAALTISNTMNQMK